MFTTDEETKHRKKKDNGSKSKKRSNHKHIYEEVIMEHWFYSFGFAWMKRCSVCGRIQKLGFAQSVEGLLKPRNHKYISRNDFLSVEELKKKFPGVRIFKRVPAPNGEISFDDRDVEEV